jgi:prepilin-type N-terminal cleavage/methylation domain-containing protein
MARRLRKGERGFTLVELLVAMAAVGIVAAGILSVFLSSMKTFADQNNRMTSQDSARLGIEQLARYVRGACSSASNLSSVSDSIAYAQPQELVFYVNMDADSAPEKVRYYVSGTTLLMQVAEPIMTSIPPTYPGTYASNEPVILGVANGTNAIFTYFAYSGSTDAVVQIASPTTAAELTSIVAVDIDLRVNDKASLSRAPVELQTRVQIRDRFPFGL